MQNKQSTCLFNHPVPRRSRTIVFNGHWAWGKKIMDNILYKCTFRLQFCPQNLHLQKRSVIKTYIYVVKCLITLKEAYCSCALSSAMFRKSIARYDFFSHETIYERINSYNFNIENRKQLYIRIDMKWSLFLMMSSG